MSRRLFFVAGARASYGHAGRGGGVPYGFTRFGGRSVGSLGAGLRAARGCRPSIGRVLSVAVGVTMCRAGLPSFGFLGEFTAVATGRFVKMRLLSSKRRCRPDLYPARARRRSGPDEFHHSASYGRPRLSSCRRCRVRVVRYSSAGPICNAPGPLAPAFESSLHFSLAGVFIRWRSGLLDAAPPPASVASPSSRGQNDNGQVSTADFRRQGGR